MSEELLATTKVTRRFQITVPRNIRKELKIEEGDVVGYFKVNNKILIRPVKIKYE